jgi:glycine oxidase
MSRAPASADVAVVGGGVIGCAVARALARRGLRVHVLERGIPGREATWAAAGMLAPRSEAGGPGEFLELGLRSLAAYPGLVAALLEETGVDAGLALTGKLDVALGGDEAERLRAAAHRSGGALEWVDAGDLRRLEPDLTEDAVGGVWSASEGSVDSRRLVRALWLAAARAGARFRVGVGVAAVERRAGAAFRLRLEDGGTLEAGRVVVAAGAWSAALAGPSGPVPVRPVRGQMASLRSADGPRHVVYSSAGYALRREAALALAGATEEEAGFEDQVTAGGVEAVLGGWRRLFPALGGAPMGATWSGLRPATPDGLPIIGPDPAEPAFWYATGHHRNGILLAPETARVCAAGIADGAAPPERFAPERFLGPRVRPDRPARDEDAARDPLEASP